MHTSLIMGNMKTLSRKICTDGAIQRKDGGRKPTVLDLLCVPPLTQGPEHADTAGAPPCAAPANGQRIHGTALKLVIPENDAAASSD